MEHLFPACAGVIPPPRFDLQSLPAFPRVCGGDPGCNLGLRDSRVFSPRVRG